MPGRWTVPSGGSGVAALATLWLPSHTAPGVMVRRHGRVFAAGATSSVLKPELVQDAYGVRASVLSHPQTGRPQTGRPMVAFSPRD